MITQFRSMLMRTEFDHMAACRRSLRGIYDSESRVDFSIAFRVALRVNSTPAAALASDGGRVDESSPLERATSAELRIRRQRKWRRAREMNAASPAPTVLESPATRRVTVPLRAFTTTTPRSY
jgi:hypothetical protein